MKKFLSMVLTLILVLNIFVGTGIFAFATEGGSAELGDEECTHTDDADNYGNVCDICGEYIGTDELAIGENTVVMTDYWSEIYQLVRFVPTESGVYTFYSTGVDLDPRGCLLDSDLLQIAFNDDNQWGLSYRYDFGFTAELVAGETYYLSVTSYGMSGMDSIERSVTIAKHTTHTDGADNYNNLCDKCNSYLLDYDLELGEYTIDLPENKYYTGRFVPQTDGSYRFVVNNPDDALNVSLCGENLNDIYCSKIETEDAIELVADLTAGKIYYFMLWDYVGGAIERAFKVEAHTHSGGVQTCKGYLCDCGFYYGEAGTEHRLGEQTCEGYECIDCGHFFGETNDNHMRLSTTQTCKGYMCWGCFRYIGEKGEHRLDSIQYCAGYKCLDCFKYFGEGTGEHADDDADNLCDVCKLYLDDQVIVLGENTVPSSSDGIYIQFTPSVSARYHIYSTANEGNDTSVYIYDSEMFYMNYSGIGGEGNNFLLKVDLIAGETYYLELNNYNIVDETYTVIVETHEHSDGEQYCKGYLCVDCGEYYGEGNDNHSWMSGWCRICYEDCAHTGTSDTQTCQGFLCECGAYYGEGNDDHSWYEGVCENCYAECEHTGTSEVQTCQGFLCECGAYYGEGNDNHFDGNDENHNLCDGCNKYLGEVDAVLGENTVSVICSEETYVRFIPSESGLYKIYSQSSYDPEINVYDMQFEHIIDADDDDDDYNFILYIEITAGITYYFAFYEHNDDNELTYFVEKHEHIPNCLGECICGLPMGTVGDHMDGEDNYNGRCDDCDVYIGEDVVMGENTVSLKEKEYTYFSFIPTESGFYKIYSQSEDDPKITIYDNPTMDDDSFVGDADDDDDYNFILYVELTAGTTYYLELYEYGSDNDLKFFIEKHEHSKTLTCVGYMCDCGYVDDSEIDEDAHVWSYGYCEFHDDVTYPDDMECTHTWDEGECEICGDEHDCTEFGDDGACVVCGYHMYYVVVITNGEKAFFNGIESALEAAVDGSVVKLLGHLMFDNNGIDVYKKVTLDLNGYSIYQPSSHKINFYSQVTLMDSYGGGRCEFEICLYAPAIIAGGEYAYISIQFETEDTISDYLAPCAYFAYYDTLEDKAVSYTEIAFEHNEKQICTGVVCTDCGEELEGEGDPDVHNFVDYDLCEDGTCISNAKECSTCEWCGEATDTRDIENSKTPHNYKPVYGEGYKECLDCDNTVEDVRYSSNAAREFAGEVVRNTYEFIKGLVVGFVEDKFAFLFEE